VTPGNAFFAMWCGVDPLHEREFDRIHARDHLRAHLAYLGEDAILSGRRYVDGIGDLPRFFMLYDMASLEPLTAPSHRACKVADSEPFLRVRPHLRDVIRDHANVVARRGGGMGGYVATVLARHQVDMEFRPICERIAQSAVAREGCTAILIGAVAPGVPTRAGQPIAPRAPDAATLVVVVEGHDRQLLSNDLSWLLREIAARGLAVGPMRSGHYALSHALSYADIDRMPGLAEIT